MRARIVLAALLLAGGVAGCKSASQALGMTKVQPDEFRVVTKAPLTLPPDYSLRPPMPGEPRAQELQPESAARQALLGERDAEARSEGERLLATKAGADKADPLVRFVVDDEFGSLAHKDRGFADWVMFWRRGQPASAPAQSAAAAGAETSAPINPAVEARRIQGLTGDQQVVIARRTSTKVKLPGL